MSLDIVFTPANQCGHKHGYHSKARAKKIARITETNFRGGRIQPYRCAWCSVPGAPIWHVGHRPHPDAIASALSRAESA